MKHILSILFFLLISISSIYGQEQVSYQAAQYPDGKEELTKKVAEELRISKKLFNAMIKENVHSVTSTVGLIVNSKGKVVAFEVLQTTHPLMDEKSFPKLIKALEDITFIPGSINGESATTTIIVEGVMAAIVPQQ